MVIWIDVIILENFIVDIFLLIITAQTIRVRSNGSHTALAAIIGSMYTLTLVYPKIYFFSKMPFKFLVAAIMLIITFGKKDVIFYIKTFGIFISYAMILAGTCIFMEFNKKSYIDFSGGFMDFSYKELLICLMIIYMFIDRIVVYIRDRKSIQKLIYTVEIITEKKNKKISAFLDTGNELREPVTNLPVIIIEKEILNDLDIEKYDKIYVPYKVVDGHSGKLEAFKPECVKIYYKEKVESRTAIIAFCESKLSNLGDYNALLSRGII